MVVVDALEGEAADKLEAHAAVAVNELEDVVVAVDELEEGVAVAVTEHCLGTGEVGRVELTAAAAYVTDRLSFSSSRKHSVGSFGPTQVAMRRISSRAPWKSEVVITPKLLVCCTKASLAWAGV